MLKWAIIFFLVALVAAFFGFGGIASGADTMAKVAFFGCLVAAAILLVMGRTSRRTV